MDENLKSTKLPKRASPFTLQTLPINIRSSSLASTIHHIQLLRLFNQKSPFRESRKLSKKSDCPHTIHGGKNAKPSFRMWICGCLVEGDVITISIEATFFLLSSLFSFFARPILALVKRGKSCRFWTFSRHFARMRPFFCMLFFSDGLLDPDGRENVAA